MKIGIVVFPGSNCDYDCFSAVSLLGVKDVSYVWHKDVNPGMFDAYILPGGFSYGDYLRCGAIARFSPVMEAVREHANAGRLVIGICNGFQILCEAGLLPGALYMNNSLNFICEHVYIRTESIETPFTTHCSTGQVLNIPIAHGEGHYYADDDTIHMLEDDRRIIFRYCTREGEVTPEANPNGSRHNIAGIRNENGNVLGMMPHPERAADDLLGSSDGRYILESLISSII
jgi:phosphoribosylformylglycinamidine synthase